MIDIDRSAYLAMENIQFFLAAVSNFGVSADKLFAPLVSTKICTAIAIA